MAKSKMVFCDEFRLLASSKDGDKRTKYKKGTAGQRQALRTGCLLTRDFVDKSNANFADSGVVYDIDEEKTDAYYKDCEDVLKERAEQEKVQEALTEVLGKTIESGLKSGRKTKK